MSIDGTGFNDPSGPPSDGYSDYCSLGYYSILGSGWLNIDVLGDMNDDDNLTSADVPLFIQALTNRAAYDAQGFGVDADTIGDINGDGTFNFGDIAGFNALFAGPAAAGAAAVPEPATFSVAVVLLMGIAIRRRRRVQVVV